MMTRKPPIRFRLFRPQDVSARFETIADGPGATRPSILTGALMPCLERRGASKIEQQFAIRLDRISRQLERIERSGRVELESFALFIRYMLAVNTPLAEKDEVSRVIGRDRFNAFVNRVGQQLASGKRTFDPESLA